jgi:ACS family hexuronate transporter-like MFS transporter
MVFFASGAVGLAWVVWWYFSYRGSNDATMATIDARLITPEFSFLDLVSMRRVQVLVFAKFMSDSAWYFYLFWLPKYLYDVRGFDVKQVSYYAWIPYAASGIGSFLGGWLSSAMLSRGRSLDFSRKFVLGLSALFMPVVMLVPHVPVGWALGLFSIAFFCQQSWSGLIMTLPADIFPLSAVGSVSGLVGFGGAIGGAIFGVVAGFLLGHGFGYGTLFRVVGSFHLIGFLAILLFGGKVQTLKTPDLRLKAGQI